MENEDLIKKPLVRQIYDELIANIEKHDEFDEGIIKTMNELATRGELKKDKKVMEAIKKVVNKDENIGTRN
jgi:hypothetical protein